MQFSALIVEGDGSGGPFHSICRSRDDAQQDAEIGKDWHVNFSSFFNFLSLIE